MSGFLSHSLSFLAPRHLSPPTTPSLASAASLLPRASAPLLMSHPQLGCLPFPASLAVSPGTSFLQPSSPACLLASSLPLSLSQAAQLLLLLLLLPSVALLLLLLQPPGGARRPKRTAAEKQAGTMAGSAALLLLPRVALALALAGASQSPPPQSPDDDPFAAQLGDISACRLRCTQSLPSPGTAAKNAVFNACYRGCRLFSICHFVDPTAELNATRAECESACMEAYTGGEERFGCTTGCRTQFPDVESRGEKIPDQKPASFSVFDLVSNFCNDIVSSAQSFISSTWTFYLQADDGKVVVFQSQPEIEYPIPEVQAPKSEVSEKAWTVSSPNTLKPHTGLREKLEKPPVEEPKSRAKMQPPVETQPPPEHDFLGCMSKRSGLPRWILAACLFLSIMVMLWLSCASLVTAPDQHIKTQPLSINGDKEYLDDLDGPTPYSLRPVIAVTICPADENEEAGLLPVKVDLDKTTL